MKLRQWPRIFWRLIALALLIGAGVSIGGYVFLSQLSDPGIEPWDFSQSRVDDSTGQVTPVHPYCNLLYVPDYHVALPCDERLLAADVRRRSADRSKAGNSDGAGPGGGSQATEEASPGRSSPGQSPVSSIMIQSNFTPPDEAALAELCRAHPPRCPVQWITYLTTCNLGTNRLAHSLHATGIPLSVLGLGTWWKNRWGLRMRALHTFLETYPEDTLIIFTDAEDVMPVPSTTPAAVLARYADLVRLYQGPLVFFPAETICYPRGELWSNFTDPKDVPGGQGWSPVRYLNAGVMIGPAGLVRRLIGLLYQHDCYDDQLVYTLAHIDPIVWWRESDTLIDRSSADANEAHSNASEQESNTADGDNVPSSQLPRPPESQRGPMQAAEESDRKAPTDEENRSNGRSTEQPEKHVKDEEYSTEGRPKEQSEEHAGAASKATDRGGKQAASAEEMQAGSPGQAPSRRVGATDEGEGIRGRMGGHSVHTADAVDRGSGGHGREAEKEAGVPIPPAGHSRREARVPKRPSVMRAPQRPTAVERGRDGQGKDVEELAGEHNRRLREQAEGLSLFDSNRSGRRDQQRLEDVSSLFESIRIAATAHRRASSIPASARPLLGLDLWQHLLMAMYDLEVPKFSVDAERRSVRYSDTHSTPLILHQNGNKKNNCILEILAKELGYLYDAEKIERCRRRGLPWSVAVAEQGGNGKERKGKQGEQGLR